MPQDPSKGATLTHSYLDARGSEVGDFELDADGRLAFLVFSFHTREAKVGPHQVLLATLGANVGDSEAAAQSTTSCVVSQASPWLPRAEAGQAVK